MIVYGSTLSPFVRKVTLFAAEKGLEVTVTMDGVMQREGPFLEASPFGLMPGFRDGDFALSDSSAIVTYIEAKHPEPNLIPEAPEARARAIWYEEFGDTMLMPLAGRVFGNRFVRPRVMRAEPDLATADAAERDDLPRMYDYLERIVPDDGFLVEDRFTLADIAVACPLANLRYVGRGVDAGRYPRTAAYLDRIFARPTMAQCIAADEAAVAAMGGPVTEPATA